MALGSIYPDTDLEFGLEIQFLPDDHPSHQLGGKLFKIAGVITLLLSVVAEIAIYVLVEIGSSHNHLANYLFVHALSETRATSPTAY